MNRITSNLPTVLELEENVAASMLATGELEITEFGSENTYYAGEDGLCFFCKNYPTQEMKDDFMQGSEEY